MDTDLNPTLLLTPFRVQTNWHVITGAPCSGKSTLINQLTDAGYQTAPEPGRIFMEQEIAAGRTINEIREDAVSTLHGIIDMTLQILKELDPTEMIFLDRGYPDSLAFSRQMGLDPNLYLPDCFTYHYASVFMLDRFPVQLDGVRIEDEAAANYLDQWHYNDYMVLGYNVVKVPVLPPEERLAFILEKLPTKSKNSN